MTDKLLAKGLGASPGRASGPAVFSAAAAIANAKAGRAAVLVCIEAGAEDGDAIRACAALVTTRGGVTGDGAIIARALGKPCLTSCSNVIVHTRERRLTVGDRSVAEGDLVEVDAAAGTLSLG
jgi:pyruvate,orthophosphate dikinase